jgi:hypothetical protein
VIEALERLAIKVPIWCDAVLIPHDEEKALAERIAPIIAW